MPAFCTVGCMHVASMQNQKELALPLLEAQETGNSSQFIHTGMLCRSPPIAHRPASAQRHALVRVTSCFQSLIGHRMHPKSPQLPRRPDLQLQLYHSQSSRCRSSQVNTNQSHSHMWHCASSHRTDITRTLDFATRHAEVKEYIKLSRFKSFGTPVLP